MIDAIRLVAALLTALGAPARVAPPRAPAVPAICTPVDASDRDEDGVPDECEARLAAVFAPELLADPEDCLWDGGDQHGARLRGGYLFAVAPLERGGVRIAYLPAYFRDCGWSGPARWMRLGLSDAHTGDSELIVLELSPDSAAGGWEVVAVFLSAHCGGRAGGQCQWFRGRELREFEWTAEPRRSPPRVWVSSGKHAHYRSRGDCERGHWWQEGCERRSVAYRFPMVSPAQNIGSRARPAGVAAGCFTTEALPLGTAGAAPGAMECMWNEWLPFRGWQSERDGDAPAPYARLLRTHAGM